MSVFSIASDYTVLILNRLVKEKSNVIIRKLGIKKVLADTGDAIGIRKFEPSSVPKEKGNLTGYRGLD